MLANAQQIETSAESNLSDKNETNTNSREIGRGIIRISQVDDGQSIRLGRGLISLVTEHTKK
jgi:hypothetical protein